MAGRKLKPSVVKTKRLTENPFEQVPFYNMGLFPSGCPVAKLFSELLHQAAQCGARHED